MKEFRISEKYVHVLRNLANVLQRMSVTRIMHSFGLTQTAEGAFKVRENRDKLTAYEPVRITRYHVTVTHYFKK